MLACSYSLHTLAAEAVDGKSQSMQQNYELVFCQQSEGFVSFRIALEGRGAAVSCRRGNTVATGTPARPTLYSTHAVMLSTATRRDTQLLFSSPIRGHLEAPGGYSEALSKGTNLPHFR